MVHPTAVELALIIIFIIALIIVEGITKIRSAKSDYTHPNWMFHLSSSPFQPLTTENPPSSLSAADSQRPFQSMIFGALTQSADALPSTAICSCKPARWRWNSRVALLEECPRWDHLLQSFMRDSWRCPIFSTTEGMRIKLGTSRYRLTACRWGWFSVGRWTGKALDWEMKWWSWTGSNRRPLECHSSALPAELQPHKLKI